MLIIEPVMLGITLFLIIITLPIGIMGGFEWYRLKGNFNQKYTTCASLTIGVLMIVSLFIPHSPTIYWIDYKVLEMEFPEVFIP